MQKKQYILDKWEDDEILFADGLDDAIIGYDPINQRVVYSISDCIEVMSKDMSVDDAIEYLEYNTFNAYVGDKTPIWVDDNKHFY